jgi:CRISPR/Cas system-associated exonuclease Cas4 (RecB family)
MENGKAIEVDFLIRIGKKLSPIEVKSSDYLEHASLDKLRKKHSIHLGDSYIVYEKDFLIKKGIIYLPIYMIGLI